MEWMRALLISGTPPAFWSQHWQASKLPTWSVQQCTHPQHQPQQHQEQHEQQQREQQHQQQQGASYQPADFPQAVQGMQPASLQPQGQCQGDDTAERSSTHQRSGPSQDLGLKPLMHSHNMQCSQLLPGQLLHAVAASDSRTSADEPNISNQISHVHATSPSNLPDTALGNVSQSVSPTEGAQYTGHELRHSASHSAVREQTSEGVYSYLEQLPNELVACRRILQYSFVLDYYMQISADQARWAALQG